MSAEDSTTEEKLERLRDWHERGLIDNDEYKSQKARVLENDSCNVAIPVALPVAAPPPSPPTPPPPPQLSGNSPPGREDSSPIDPDVSVRTPQQSSALETEAKTSEAWASDKACCGSGAALTNYMLCQYHEDERQTTVLKYCCCFLPFAVVFIVGLTYFVIFSSEIWVDGTCVGVMKEEYPEEWWNLTLPSAAGCDSISGESMTGFGADYRGCQNITKKGFVCMPWDVDLPHNISRILRFDYNVDDATRASSLKSNYCRNPYPYEVPNRPSIWCLVNDSGYYTFDSCSSIGEPFDYHLHPHQCVYYTEEKGKTAAGGRYVLVRSTRYKSKLQHTIYFYDKRAKFFEDIDQGRKEPGDNVDEFCQFSAHTSA
ncbi:hypothetical protein CYMTET_49563 [Cymbomonas tetramitiformis]|uniref:Kringle domain-containing protein n=1 Tax=Cymbomonas tetramitiformis TaxID=36881 RepID=A0AAE0EU06_9CHLO|nr:hypothetical protein CYMTET_49563 [Cymbomonas tetramitiformis]